MSLFIPTPLSLGTISHLDSFLGMILNAFDVCLAQLTVHNLIAFMDCLLSGLPRNLTLVPPSSMVEKRVFLGKKDGGRLLLLTRY